MFKVSRLFDICLVFVVYPCGTYLCIVQDALPCVVVTCGYAGGAALGRVDQGWTLPLTEIAL